MEGGEFTFKDIDTKGGKPNLIFGKDVKEIKCFRNSLNFGICFGVFGGLATFLLTSKTLFSVNIAFATFWIGTFGYWIPCRYKYETNELLQRAAAIKRF